MHCDKPRSFAVTLAVCNCTLNTIQLWLLALLPSLLTSESVLLSCIQTTRNAVVFVSTNLLVSKCSVLMFAYYASLHSQHMQLSIR